MSTTGDNSKPKASSGATFDDIREDATPGVPRTPEALAEWVADRLVERGVREGGPEGRARFVQTFARRVRLVATGELRNEGRTD